MLNSEQIIEKIRKNDSSLLETSLSESSFGNDGAKILAKALEKNTALKSLELGSSNIGPEGAKALATALSKGCNLKTLYLRGNKIGDIGFRAFAEALKINKSLEHLYLGKNEITIEGVKSFEETLTKNSTLQTIYLRNNNITDAGAQILSEALTKNFGLRVINLANAELTEVGCRALLKMLDSNTTLQSVVFEHNGVESPEIVRAFADKLEYNSSLVVTTSNNIAKKVLAHVEEYRELEKIEEDKNAESFKNLVEKFSLSRFEQYHYSGNNSYGNAILCIGFLSRMIFAKYLDKNSGDEIIKTLHLLYKDMINRAKQDLENPQTTKPNQQVLEAAKKIIF
ncbi:MAG: hypothetical protein EBS06_00575 [Proteobacteria bacterium]|nr:hypothetical protein [Pseudomonadota bacterium]